MGSNEISPEVTGPCESGEISRDGKRVRGACAEEEEGGGAGRSGAAGDVRGRVGEIEWRAVKRTTRSRLFKHVFQAFF